MLELDTYQKALPVLLRQHTRVNFILVGAGGTGGYLAEDLCKIILQLQRNRKQADLMIIDPDKVETANTIRQSYQLAEVGLYKAQTLALRCSAKYKIEITTICNWFEEDFIDNSWNTLTVLVGCVDNATARTKINSALKRNNLTEPASLFWLDCGNSSTSGQVVIGSHSNFDILGACDKQNDPKFLFHLPSRGKNLLKTSNLPPLKG